MILRKETETPFEFFSVSPFNLSIRMNNTPQGDGNLVVATTTLAPILLAIRMNNTP